MLQLLQTTVTPPLSLQKCLTNCPAISLALREAPRKRQLQAAQLEQSMSLLF